jgi:hypothetical protein
MMANFHHPEEEARREGVVFIPAVVAKKIPRMARRNQRAIARRFILP